MNKIENEAHSFIDRLEARLTGEEEDLSSLSGEEQFEMLSARAVHIVKEDLLKQRLIESRKSGKPLHVKFGVDPTGADLHLGHIVPLIVARRLLRMGHEVTIIIGDFTALVGDPSGRVKSRPVLTKQDIEHNIRSYKQQIGKFIPVDRVRFQYNSQFYDDLSMSELFRLYGGVRISPLMQREDFRKRMEGLTIAEALYPTLMAIDSVRLGSDIELGGDDQLLNFHITNDFLRAAGMEPQSALTTGLLLSTAGDGRKMSKSEGNYIAIRENPTDAYGKAASIPDSLMESYFKLLTDISDEEWSRLQSYMDEGLNPFEVKKLLARIITTFLHDAGTARREQQKFERLFAKKKLPDDMEEFDLSGHEEIKTPVDLMRAVGFAASNGEARRLVKGGAVRFFIDGETIKVTDPLGSLPDASEYVLNSGKRKFIRVRG